MKHVRMLKAFPPNMPGDWCTFEDSVANRLIRQRKAVPLDETGAEVPFSLPAEDEADDGLDDGDTFSDASDAEDFDEEDVDNLGDNQGEETQSGAPGDESPISPFEVDGLSAGVVKALNDAGMKSPDDVRAFIKAGKSLADLPVIGKKRAKQIEEMYFTFHGDDVEEDSEDADAQDSSSEGSSSDNSGSDSASDQDD